MKLDELTGRVPAATRLPMQTGCEGKRRSGRSGFGVAVLMGCTMALGGCVTVNAPDKAIVIELNINIKHDIIVELAQHAEKTMDEHKDIF